MLKQLTIVFSLTTALAATAFAQAVVDPRTAPPAAQQSVAGDAEFLVQAGQVAEAEMALAALAQKQATDQRIKSLADMLKRDHEAARTELQKLATPRKAELTGMTVGQLAVHNRLEKMTGADFDRAWVEAIIEQHRDTRGLFSRASRSADAEIKSFATLQATNLENHLKQAKALQSSELGW
jgi:putative membrane protein